MITSPLLLCAALSTGAEAQEVHTAYLMAYFGPQEQLYYAWSRDARRWTALNGGRPVFDAGVRLRDPFVQRVGDRFHLVHTKGWDHPTLYHWESTDLIDWEGGPIDVVPPDRVRAWAPEFFYEESSGLFHVFWASIHDGHNTMHVVTTRDWSDITPDRSRIFYDLGIHDIDLTIVEHDGRYYGFHKPGGVEDVMGNRLSTSLTLDAVTNTFGAGGPGAVVLEGEVKPTEGPELIELIGEERWYVYGDPFNSPMQAWETTDFVEFARIDVETVPGSKHCSMLSITEAELERLLEEYPDPHSPAYERQRGITTLLPHAKKAPGEWRYTTSEPTADWFERGFDDSEWASGKGGFGTPETPNTAVGTLWNTPEIWLRRAFVVDERVPGGLYLELHHDEDSTVFLNGVEAASVTSYTTDFALVPLREEAAATLKPGENVIALHCRQTTGGQYVDVGLIAVQEQRWSRERAWEWYRDQPWPCGFNYVPANAISYTEMWMPYAFDAALIDEELALAEEIGFNCLRVVLPFVVWEHDPEAFEERLRAFLEICDAHGLKVMPTLFDDCAFGPITDPVYGEQPAVVEGWYANGWTPSPGHDLVRRASTWPRLEEYVKSVLTAFADDPRVWVWDLYNEPTNGGLGAASVPLVESVFRWAREVDPSQPLTVGQFNGFEELNRVIFTHSDVITFHDYGPAGALRRHLERLEAYGRPLINTEWLNRGRGSGVATCLPVFAEAGVGCLHWGLVNGKTQTHLNWGHRPGDPDPPVWQHDLFTSEREPYDAAELELFRETIRSGAQPGRLQGRWSVDEASAWYAELPWLVGCNFIPSTAVNQLEMWQAQSFDPETIERELGWAAGLGMNVVRVYLHDLAHEQDPDGFLERVERFLGLADSHGIGTVFVIFDDCWLAEPEAGPQPQPWPGVHNSGWLESPGLPQLQRYREDPALRRRLEGYLKAVLTRFRDDPRVLLWDLYNEPGGWWYRRGEAPGSYERGLTGALCVPLLSDAYRWAREVAPSQPLTSGWYRGELEEEAALRWADVVTFHHYGDVTGVEALIERLQREAPKRPILCTEYLFRQGGSRFQSHLPVFLEHRVGAINWGLVAGKTNTIWGWGSWDQPATGEPETWFHDVLRRDGTPYDDEEAAFLRAVTEEGRAR